MPIAKPYSLAGVLLFIAYLAVGRCSAVRSGWWAATGGLSLALAVDTRSYLLLTAPLFLWWIFRNSVARSTAIRWFVAGFAAGLLPSFYFLLSFPSAFVFDNLGYHAIRTNEGLVGMWGEKLVVILMLLLGGPEGNGIQNSLLLVTTLGFIFSIRKSGWLPRLAFQLAVLLAFISLLPTPVLPQYFSFCIPFLVVSAVCVTNQLMQNLEPGTYRWLGASACALAVVIYVAASVPDFRKYLVTGDGIPTVRTLRDPWNWRLSAVKEVSGAIDRTARPGETVASFWSGYMFETHAVPLAGLEGDCGVLVADKLSAEQRTRYHIVSWSELEAEFAAHRPRVAVLVNHHSTRNVLVPEALGDDAASFLSSHGYDITESFGNTSIYVCCSQEAFP
jgi:hypothetical protein